MLLLGILINLVVLELVEESTNKVNTIEQRHADRYFKLKVKAQKFKNCQYVFGSHKPDLHKPLRDVKTLMSKHNVARLVCEYHWTGLFALAVASPSGARQAVVQMHRSCHLDQPARRPWCGCGVCAIAACSGPCLSAAEYQHVTKYTFMLALQRQAAGTAEALHRCVAKVGSACSQG